MANENEICFTLKIVGTPSGSDKFQKLKIDLDFAHPFAGTSNGHDDESVELASLAPGAAFDQALDAVKRLVKSIVDNDDPKNQNHFDLIKNATARANNRGVYREKDGARVSRIRFDKASPRQLTVSFDAYSTSTNGDMRPPNL